MRKILILFVLMVVSLLVRSAPVYFQPFVIENPDGKKYDVFVSGDEFFNFIHDADGYLIIQGNDGYYYYTEKNGNELIPSNTKYPTNKLKSTSFVNMKTLDYDYSDKANENLKYIKNDNIGKGSIHVGTYNNIVIFIRFSDDAEIVQTIQYFNSVFNENHPNVSSVYKYFREVSYNKLEIISHFYPEQTESTYTVSYVDPNPRGYYQPYNATTNPIGYKGGDSGSERISREHTLLQNAVLFVNSLIPQSLNIDIDGNGMVDNVCFVIKGDSGAWASLLWAHRWVLYTKTVEINGKRVWDYTFQPQSQATAKIICHEMFHSLGAPDLYHYSYDGLNPVGDWDLMHSGFAHMGAYMKWKYAGQKWIETIPTISTPGRYTLQPLATNPENCVFKILSDSTTTEYYIVEYRKRVIGTFEINIPGSGLVIYRINKSSGNGNAQGPPDEVYIYRPNGTLTVNGILSYANYTNAMSRVKIDENTNPTPFLSDGRFGGLRIYNITENPNNSISFDLQTENPNTYTLTVSVNPQNSGKITIN